MSEDQMTSKDFVSMIKISPALIPLLLKTGISLFKMNREAKKAGKIFMGKLLDAGIDTEMANAMKEEYLETSKFLKMIYHSFKSNVQDS